MNILVLVTAVLSTVILALDYYANKELMKDLDEVRILLKQFKRINQCADAVEKYKAEKTERMKARINQ